MNTTDWSLHRIYSEDIERILACPLPWDRLKNKAVLIAGASGCVGSVLTDVLVRADEKYGLHIKLHLLSRHMPKLYLQMDGKRVFFHAQDIQVGLDALSDIDYCIHAASLTHPLAYVSHPIDTLMTDILGSRHQLELLRKKEGSRFLYISSVEVYGQHERETPIGEHDFGALDCNSLRANYCEAKRASEALCASYREQYGSDYVIARLCRLYGPSIRQDDSKAVSQFLLHARDKKDIVLKSAGRQLFSYAYITDATAGLLTVLLHGESAEAYNIAGPEPVMSLKEIASVAAACAGTRVVHNTASAKEAAGYSRSVYAVLDTAKLRSLGWRPVVSLEAGIKRTLECWGAEVRQ